MSKQKNPFTPESKTCTACGTTYKGSSVPDNFYRCKQSSDHLSPRCKFCAKKAVTDSRRRQKNQTSQCMLCQQEVPYTEILSASAYGYKLPSYVRDKHDDIYICKACAMWSASKRLVDLWKRFDNTELDQDHPSTEKLNSEDDEQDPNKLYDPEGIELDPETGLPIVPEENQIQ